MIVLKKYISVKEIEYMIFAICLLTGLTRW